MLTQVMFGKINRQGLRDKPVQVRGFMGFRPKTFDLGPQQIFEPKIHPESFRQIHGKM